MIIQSKRIWVVNTWLAAQVEVEEGMKLVTLVSNNVGVDTYLELRKAVNFKPLSRTQAKKALDNSLYIVCAYIDAKIVGMGRLVGDGAVICYIQDLMIHPDYQHYGSYLLSSILFSSTF